MANPKLRKNQDQCVKEFIEREVLTSLPAHENYVKKVDNFTKRFEAVRSIQGLSYGADPDRFPKTEPWKYSSDVGVPIEAITIRAIIARFVKTIFTKPICNITGRGAQDKEEAKVMLEYNEYTLEDEMNFERNFYDIMMDVCLAGDGTGKLIEADEEYEWEETYFTLIHPENGEPIPDPSTKSEYENEEWPNGYPIEVDENFEPEADIITGLRPEVVEITVEKKDKTYFGTKLIPVDPRDILLPEGADTYDYNELPWLGHRFKKNWHWLEGKVGDIEDGGYDKDVVEKLRPQTDTKKKVSTVPKIQLVEMWGKLDMPTNLSGDKHKVREIIALYALEKGELLGWIPNPYKGKKMFFHWQIMPMPHRARAKSIPEFAKGLRELVDSLFNNKVNRDTINSHPPFIYDEESGFDPEVHEFGPQEFWGVSDQTRIGRLDMGGYVEGDSRWIIEFSMGMLQRLFGVSDQTVGIADPHNQTFRGIQALIGEGNFSFDTMISLLQMTNKKFFEANILMHAKMMKDTGMENKVFFVTESQDNPYRKISAESMSLKWNFKPRGTSINDNIHRRRKDANESYDKMSGNVLFNPQLTPTTADNYREITQNYVDTYDLKGVNLPTHEEMQEELIKVKAAVEQRIKEYEQYEQLKAIAKHKKNTPEGIAAQKTIADIEMSGKKPEKPETPSKRRR